MVAATICTAVRARQGATVAPGERIGESAALTERPLCPELLSLRRAATLRLVLSLVTASWSILRQRTTDEQVCMGYGERREFACLPRRCVLVRKTGAAPFLIYREYYWNRRDASTIGFYPSSGSWSRGPGVTLPLLRPRRMESAG